VKAASRFESEARPSLTPEEIFFAWLLDLPEDVDPCVAAAEQVALIDRYPARSERAQRLRELFAAAAVSAVSPRRTN
jgi:hypothetical protein